MRSAISWDVMLRQVDLFLPDLFLFSNWDWGKSYVPSSFNYSNFEFEIEKKIEDSDFELRK
jgi:hypothetical protein